jgi:predicted glycosyltransferase
MYVRSNDAGRDDAGRRSIALYSHDGFGLGHLSRSIHLAHCIRALEPRANILIITSSPAVRYLVLPEEFEYIKLPPVTHRIREGGGGHAAGAGL